MILRFIKPVFFILLLSNCNYSFAEINAEHESELLYTTLKFNDIMEKNLHVYVDQSLKRNPIAVKYKNRVISFYRKHVGPESLKPYVIDIMIEMFTAQELKKLNTFYASPTGNKSLKLMPALSKEIFKIAQQNLEENIGVLRNELLEKIKSEPDFMNKSQNN